MMLKMKMRFDVMSDILLYLIRELSIPLKVVKQLVQHNSDVGNCSAFGPKAGIDRRLSPQQGIASLSKQEKLLALIGTVATYLNDGAQLLALPKVSKAFLNSPQSIYSQVLSSCSFANSESIRRRLFLSYAHSSSCVKAYGSATAHKPDRLIALDAKRTFCPDEHFRRDALIALLNNVSDPSVG